MDWAGGVQLKKLLVHEDMKWYISIASFFLQNDRYVYKRDFIENMYTDPTMNRSKRSVFKRSLNEAILDKKVYANLNKCISYLNAEVQISMDDAEMKAALSALNRIMLANERRRGIECSYE
jgi:hypothetical protein